MKNNRIKFLNILTLATNILVVAPVVQASTIMWQGHTWTIKSATGAGPGPNNWSANNVFVDTNGNLHLKITYNNTSGKWDCAELYTTSNLGFGTYQWQTESRVDVLDPWVVLGLFPYAGPDGRNEIDIEYSRWSDPNAANGGWTVYPNTGTRIVTKSFRFSLSETYATTSRFIWNSNGVQYWLLNGFQPVGTATNVINSWNYAPSNPSVNIPQSAMPLHMNLWLNKGHAPANGQPAEVIISNFQFVPWGSAKSAQLSQLTLLAGGDVQLSVQGEAGWHYQIFSSSNLLDWVEITGLLASNNLFQVTDTNLTSLSPRFYRTLTEL